MYTYTSHCRLFTQTISRMKLSTNNKALIPQLNITKMYRIWPLRFFFQTDFQMTRVGGCTVICQPVSLLIVVSYCCDFTDYLAPVHQGKTLVGGNTVTPVAVNGSVYSAKCLQLVIYYYKTGIIINMKWEGPVCGCRLC